MSNNNTFHPQNDALGYYKILNLGLEATSDEIKQNYRDLAKLWHPDHNKAANALDNFKKISVAYEVLKEEDKRLAYDLLSTVYNADKYPDLDVIKPLKAASNDPNIKAVSIDNIRGEIWKYESRTDKSVCSYKEALHLELKASVLNWLLGWWHPQAFFKNIQALINNFKNVDSKNDNLRLFIHNAVAYRQENKTELSVQSAFRALPYANSRQKALLQRFVGGQGNVLRMRPWNYLNLQLVQLIVPVIIMVAALIPFSVKVVSESDLLTYFAEKKEISYNQKVQFRTGGSMSDDMVVGKVMNIPVDTSDPSKLQHLTKETAVMYGPADDFDIIRKLKKDTTVRITGYTPDNIWFRVMMDEGEMGFIRQEYLKPGIGREIPYGSVIIKK